MDKLEQYVPTVPQSIVLQDPLTNVDVELYMDEFHYLLFGGEQLTVKRSKHERSNERREIDRLDGLITVIEDWHAKVALLKVCIM